MRAAVLHEYGTPRPDEFQEPEAGSDQSVVEVLAAGLNPVDVAICGGRFYADRPPLPPGRRLTPKDRACTLSRAVRNPRRQR